LISEIVYYLSINLKIPVTCKIRILDSYKNTIKIAKLLEKSGCSILTVHGRTIEQKHDKTGKSDWEIIKLLKEEIKIPLFSNGGIANI